MNKTSALTRRAASGIGLLAIALMLGCSSLLGINDEVRGNGVVRWFSLEGGFYAIRGEDDEVYDPINLPVEFEKDGLEIWFEAEVRRGMSSIHMVGTIVELTKIRAR
ncbi:MAG: hypothetical protein ACT443_02585 [Gemmatimonadota bacterium]